MRRTIFNNETLEIMNFRPMKFPKDCNYCNRCILSICLMHYIPIHSDFIELK